MRLQIFIPVVALVLGACGSNNSNTSAAQRINARFQSPNNHLSCTNTFFPSGLKTPVQQVAGRYSSLRLMSARVYLELRSSTGQVMANLSGDLNRPTGFGTVYKLGIGCQDVRGMNASDVQLNLDFPRAITNAKITSDLNVALDFNNTGTASTAPQVTLVSPVAPDFSTWITGLSAVATVQPYEFEEGLEIQVSQSHTPAADGSYWYEFAVLNYQTPQ
jgi:hypothetical protein